jgi:hypothetical protein
MHYYPPPPDFFFMQENKNGHLQIFLDILMKIPKIQTIEHYKKV